MSIVYDVELFVKTCVLVVYLPAVRLTGKNGLVNVSTGRHLLTYHGHADVVQAVAWSPDGNVSLLPAVTGRSRSGRLSKFVAMQASLM
jgi:WD40 repeat protein